MRSLFLLCFCCLVNFCLAGNKYSNITVVGVSSDRVETYLKKHGYEAFISIRKDSMTVIFEEKIDEYNFDVIDSLCTGITRELSCRCAFISNFDEDVLMVFLYENGVEVLIYYSRTGQMAEGPPSKVSEEVFLEFFALSKDLTGRLHSVLSSTYEKDKKYLFETDRHSELRLLIGLPEESVGFGYKYVKNMCFDFPDLYRKIVLTRVGG